MLGPVLEVCLFPFDVLIELITRCWRCVVLRSVAGIWRCFAVSVEDNKPRGQGVKSWGFQAPRKVPLQVRYVLSLL